ncbi:MAG: proline dehydrogenase family protein [Bacteroidales bacterium]
MLDTVSKGFFHVLAGSRLLKKAASRYGMARPGSFARRFVAGETIDEALAACRALQGQGAGITLDLLGESVTSLAEADLATRAYVSMMERMAASEVDRNISLKLTQLGLDIDRAICVDNVRRILETAKPLDFFVRIDMENVPYVQRTMDVFDVIWQQDYRNAGLVLQSALYRSEADLEHLIALGARVRLVKGAYKEAKSVAYQRKADVDAAYLRMMRTLLLGGNYPAIATHDEAMIGQAKRIAAENRIGRERFEFQMLYGIRRDLQAALLAEGYRLRVYVPYGREWFPYFMRRLGERPANVLFVARSVMGER